ncbi:MAG: toxin PIN [Prevotella sp.]|nr:toxin PIN [Prevotella sp.]
MKNKDMEKKQYIAPETKVVPVGMQNRIMAWSAPKATGGGNEPEAHLQMFFDEESDDNNSWKTFDPWKNVSPWNDDDSDTQEPAWE